MAISVQCQHRINGKQCGRTTNNVVGLCYAHTDSGTKLHDVNSGSGKKPIWTAIPRVGSVAAQGFKPVAGVEDNFEVVREMEAERKKRENPSLWQRIRGVFS